MTTEYWTNALVYSALGFTAGIIVGLGIKTRFNIKILDQRMRERLLGAVLILIALASQAQGLWFQRHQRGVTSCQVQESEDFRQKLRDRGEIANRDRKNINDLISGVLTLKPGDRENGRRILQTYVDKNNQLDKERANNSLPTQSLTKVCK